MAAAFRPAGRVIFANAGRLRLKESDRLATTHQLLRSLGAEAETGEDFLAVTGTGGLPGGGIADCCNDHRIAMSGAVAAALSENGAVLLGTECVGKSYPAFWEDFASLGGRIRKPSLLRTDREGKIMQFRYSIFGESHGPAIGVVLENLPSGIPVDMDFIGREMARRQAKKGGLSTTRIEADRPEILSGVFNGRTTGTPLCAVIQNGNTHSSDYDAIKTLARPSHADYTGRVRYGGFNDYRGGGHFSGRLTAPMVFAGAVMKLWLRGQGIEIGSHILRLGPIEDIPFDLAHPPVEEFPAIAARTLPVLVGRGGGTDAGGHFKGPGRADLGRRGHAGGGDRRPGRNRLPRRKPRGDYLPPRLRGPGGQRD